MKIKYESTGNNLYATCETKCPNWIEDNNAPVYVGSLYCSGGICEHFEKEVDGEKAIICNYKKEPTK